MEHSDKGGTKEMKNNVFDNKGDDKNQSTTLTHAQFAVILADAQKTGSLKEAILMTVENYYK
jgi:hypothetical protein